MPVAIQHKRNKANTNAPLATEIEEGELLIQLNTKILYTKDHTGNVIPLGNVVKIVNTLTETAAGKALDARQGVVLKTAIDDINTLLSSDDATLDELQEVVNFIKLNKTTLDTLAIANISGLQTALDGKEASFTKNTGFNKNFGTGNDDVARGDHGHDYGYYTGV